MLILRYKKKLVTKKLLLKKIFYSTKLKNDFKIQNRRKRYSVEIKGRLSMKKQKKDLKGGNSMGDLLMWCWYLLDI